MADRAPDVVAGVMYVLLAQCDVDWLGAKAGDRIIVCPGAPTPVWVAHPATTNYGRILGLWEEEAFTLLHGDPDAVGRALQQLAALRPVSLRLLPASPARSAGRA